MYRFKDTVPTSGDDRQFAKDSIYIHDLNLNIQEISPVLKIVSCSGRNDVSVKINTADSGGDGDFYLSQKIEPVNFELKGFLDCKTNDELKANVEAIYRWLINRRFWFSFEDERNFKRLGEIKECKLEEGTIKPDVKIKIQCDDPFKYGVDEEVYNINGGNFSKDDVFKLGVRNSKGYIQPYKLSIKYRLDSSVVSTGITVKAYNANDNVVSTIKTLPYSEFRDENTMELYFKAQGGEYLFVNDYPATKYLDISSELSSFGICEGGRFEIENDDFIEAKVHFRIKDLG